MWTATGGINFTLIVFILEDSNDGLELGRDLLFFSFVACAFFCFLLLFFPLHINFRRDKWREMVNSKGLHLIYTEVVVVIILLQPPIK